MKTKLDQLKYEAKQLKRQKDVTHSIALEIKAREYGFSGYHEAQIRLKDQPRDQT